MSASFKAISLLLMRITSQDLLFKLHIIDIVNIFLIVVQIQLKPFVETLHSFQRRKFQKEMDIHKLLMPQNERNTKLFNIYANFFKANELLSESLCSSKQRLVLTPSARCERKLVCFINRQTNVTANT